MTEAKIYYNYEEGFDVACAICPYCSYGNYDIIRDYSEAEYLVCGDEVTFPDIDCCEHLFSADAEKGVAYFAEHPVRRTDFEQPV